MSICDPGKNASIQTRSTTIPPLILLRILPGITSSFSKALIILSQILRKSALFLLNTKLPSSSSTLSITISTGVPILSSSVEENSFFGMVPSDLKPTK